MFSEAGQKIFCKINRVCRSFISRWSSPETDWKYLEHQHKKRSENMTVTKTHFVKINHCHRLCWWDLFLIWDDLEWFGTRLLKVNQLRPWKSPIKWDRANHPIRNFLVSFSCLSKTYVMWLVMIKFRSTHFSLLHLHLD